MAGSDGAASFELPDALPDKLYISIGRSEDSEPLSCSGGRDFVAQKVLATGILATGNCQLSNSASRLRARPGEVILFARRHDWWYRLIAPLERE